MQLIKGIKPRRFKKFKSNNEPLVNVSKWWLNKPKMTVIEFAKITLIDYRHQIRIKYKFKSTISDEIPVEFVYFETFIDDIELSGIIERALKAFQEHMEAVK